MDFQPNGTRIRNHRQVGSDDGIHTSLPGSGAQGMHLFQLFIVHDDIQRQIGFGARLMAARDDFRQIFFRKLTVARERMFSFPTPKYTESAPPCKAAARDSNDPAGP